MPERRVRVHITMVIEAISDRALGDLERGLALSLPQEFRDTGWSVVSCDAEAETVEGSERDA